MFFTRHLGSGIGDMTLAGSTLCCLANTDLFYSTTRSKDFKLHYIMVKCHKTIMITADDDRKGNNNK